MNEELIEKLVREIDAVRLIAHRIDEDMKNRLIIVIEDEIKKLKCGLQRSLHGQMRI